MAMKSPLKVTATTVDRYPYKIQIIIEGALPKATNEILGAHWKFKHGNAGKWKKIIAQAVAEIFKPTVPLMKAKISIVRMNWRMLDYDGLVASMKPVVDGLVQSGILKNDTYKITGPWIVTQEFRAKKLGPRLEILVEEA